MRIWAAGLALLLLGASEPASVADLDWMAGAWSREDGARWTEESWTSPRGGVMLGHSRSGAGDRLREFEYLRVQAGEDGVPVYIAQPGGQAPTLFKLVARDAASATFENAAHDYPQRIRYVRDGDVMTATISLIDGSKAVSWVYKRR